MRTAIDTAATTDAVTLAELRQWLAFVAGITDDDAVLESLIDEATDWVEAETNRKILTQTWAVTLDAAEIVDEIRLPVVPLASVSSVVTTDEDGTDTTVATTQYQVQTGDDPRVVLSDSGAWPTDARDHNSMVITCVCGYGGDVVPFAAASGTPDLDDLIASGTFTGSSRTTYEVEIDASGTPDTFKWRAVTRDGNGVKSYGAWTATVNCATTATALGADGISVAFGATTGHTVGDAWTAQVYEVLPPRIRMLIRGFCQHMYRSKGSGVVELESGALHGLARQFEAMVRNLRVRP